MRQGDPRILRVRGARPADALDALRAIAMAARGLSGSPRAVVRSGQGERRPVGRGLPGVRNGNAARRDKSGAIALDARLATFRCGNSALYAPGRREAERRVITDDVRRGTRATPLKGAARCL